MNTLVKEVCTYIIFNRVVTKFISLIAFYQKKLPGQETHKVGVVLTNPEMSKHLETATLSIGKIVYESCSSSHC